MKKLTIIRVVLFTFWFELGSSDTQKYIFIILIVK